MYRWRENVPSADIERWTNRKRNQKEKGKKRLWNLEFLMLVSFVLFTFAFPKIMENGQRIRGRECDRDKTTIHYENLNHLSSIRCIAHEILCFRHSICCWCSFIIICKKNFCAAIGRCCSNILHKCEDWKKRHRNFSFFFCWLNSFCVCSIKWKRFIFLIAWHLWVSKVN